MVTVEGLSLREISELWNVPYETVTHRYCRGIHYMKGLVRTDNLKSHSYRIDRSFGNGRRFLEIMVEKDMTITKLIERTGVSRSTIWNFLYNSGDISSQRLAKLCDAIGVSMDYIMGLKGERHT